ncbi:hypothetical protein D3C76_1779110 [compost metagenome]
MRTMARASSMRPWFTSQRGDSGVPMRAMRMIAAGIAEDASIQRQASSPRLSMAVPMKVAAT